MLTLPLYHRKSILLQQNTQILVKEVYARYMLELVTVQVTYS